ncbi:MAG: DUF4154 domain-containing protein [Deltaproteobacteria bacterium HGW-Deltaproteobacteria-2]|jgi:hypothetical protein|nr:MAG: DUF4154 domain-containing protein [Deltaproteobacteria bacterium HGW-Deltaproteobacteria-2]
MKYRLSIISKCALMTILFASACLSYGNLAFAEEGQPTEAQVKAAFIYNFGKFVEWPPDRWGGKYFIIGVYGDDDFAQVLREVVAGKFIHEKPVSVKRFSRMEDITGCHILFVGNDAKDNLTEIFNSVRKIPVLTVSDMQDFADRGGMINFRRVKNYIRFEINVKAAQQTGLRISAQLLKLAIIIE